MGSDVLIRIRRCFVIYTRLCFTSVYNHPFLVAFLCCLYLFHRSFPLLFSLFVSASPVLITTALLLGTLLSYGDSNLSQLHDDDDDALQPGVVASEVAVVDRDAGNSRTARDLEDDDGDDEKESERDEVKEEEDSDDEFGDDDNTPLIKGKSRNGKVGKWVSSENDDDNEASRALGEEIGHGEDGTLHKKVDVRGSYARVPDAESEKFGLDDSHLVGEAVDGPYSLNAVYTSLVLDPNREEAKDHEGSDSQNDNDHSSEFETDEDDAEDEDGNDPEDEDDDEDEDSSESESDGDESSSPDASITDIMPMLDELNPLLDVDAPQPAHDDVNSTARRSVDASSIESAEDSENQEDDDGDDDNEDAQSHKGEGDKPGITWTEDDQKNLMDMGTSELERNRRLENLIARRQARKLMRLADEKNLIDLESTDLPLNVPHISTLRRNPFDGLIDSYDMMGLPPIPGSAPSILQPRKNPFDLPYDQNEEKPVLTGDNFAQEFIPHQRDAFFRRHESFSVGPSTLGNSRPEMKWRPYFVPERTAAEEAYASIQRQLSELSESKASSVPETESVSSASNHEDRKLSEQDIMPETVMGSKDEHDSDPAEYESRSSEDEVWVDVEHVNRYLNQNEFEIQLGDQGSLEENETNMGLIDDSSIHVHLSQSESNMLASAVDEESEGSSHSSPTVEMQVAHDEISMEMGHNLDDFLETGTSFIGSVEPIRSEMHLPAELVEDGSDSSSLTSLSETNEEVSDPVDRKESIGETGDLIEDSHSAINSPVATSISLTVEIPDDHHIKEPVYDSSPQPTEKHLLFSSESTDCQPESSDVRSPAVADESVTQDTHEEFEEHIEREVIAISSSEGVNTDSSYLSIGNENHELHSVSQTAGQGYNEPSYKDEKSLHEQVQLCNMDVLTDVGQTSISETTSAPHQHIMPADATLSVTGVDQFHLEADQLSETDRGSSSDTESSEDKYVGHEDMLEVDNDSLVVQDVGPIASSDSDSLDDSMDTKNLHVDRVEPPIPRPNDDAPNHEQFSIEPVNKHADSKGESSLGVDQKPKVNETPTAESSSNNYQETMDLSSFDAESTKKTSSYDMAPRIVPEVSVAIPLKNHIIESIKGMSARGVPSDELDEFQTPVSARSFDLTSEEYRRSSTVIDEAENETENFREIDEELLAELDTVGDFSVPSSGQKILKPSVATNPDHSPSGSLTLNHISETNTDIPVFEASSVDGIDLTFHQVDDGVPVDEVILPSLLFSGRPEVDLKDVLESEPDSPVSETKEVSLKHEELVSPRSDALEKTEVVPTKSGSSVDTELQKEEDTHTQEHDPTGSPKHSTEEIAAKDLRKKGKSHDSSSDSSSSDSDSD